MENNFGNQAQFNQAFYQQTRIHDILRRVDILSTNPMQFNQSFGDYNYNVIQRDLINCFLTISAKCTTKEIEDMEKKRKLMEYIQSKHPVRFRGNNNERLINKTSLSILNQLFIEYRIEVERLMDIHGLGNPNKDDPNKAVLRF